MKITLDDKDYFDFVVEDGTGDETGDFFGIMRNSAGEFFMLFKEISGRSPRKLDEADYFSRFPKEKEWLKENRPEFFI